MEVAIIITLCVLLLLAYIFDITASITKIPSVILLLLVGWAVKQLTVALEFELPDFTSVLPILGTVGLILIVLEGSLELKINKKKLPLIGKSTFMAFVPMLLFCFGLAYAFHYWGGISMKNALANAIPFSVISSAIAIPSAKILDKKEREFVTYESSFSDIFGVIFFNFIVLNATINFSSFVTFTGEVFLLLALTFVATLFLTFLLGKIKHQIKFLPIILMIVLIYSVSKVFHLPALIFILIFGLFLENVTEIKNNRYIQKLQPEILDKEVIKFKELTIEFAFLVRALFFLLFGFLIKTEDLLNTETLIWAGGIIIGIFLIRFLFSLLFRLKINPLVFIAPRGLITILLFLSIPFAQKTELANSSLIIQVILLTVIIMMVGMMVYNKKPEEELEPDEPSKEIIPEEKKTDSVEPVLSVSNKESVDKKEDAIAPSDV